jgi:hypothetical protein
VACTNILHRDEWKNSFAYTMYFIPDFDETLGYYEAADEWW